MTTPDFNDLTPPNELYQQWCGLTWVPSPHIYDLARKAYRAGARHGYEQARQLWPEPIQDRPPTEADADPQGLIQYQLYDGIWGWVEWNKIEKLPWQHTPRWQPRQPTLKEQGLADVADLENYNFGPVVQKRLDRIRRALEQAGEGQA